MMDEFLSIEEGEFLRKQLERQTLSDVEVEAEHLAEILRSKLMDYGVDFGTLYKALYGALDADSSRKVNEHTKLIGSLIKR